MRSADSEFHKSLEYILANDPRPLMLTFTLDEELFGVHSEVELKPGGKDIEVTLENRSEYVQLVLAHKLVVRAVRAPAAARPAP